MSDAEQQPVSRKSFFLTHATVLLALVVAGAGGFSAWGQTQTKIDKLEQRTDRYEQKLDDLQKGQEINSRLLQRLDERSVGQDRVQQQILRSLESINERINRSSAADNP